ncbi:hypothetical protein RYX36_002997 [Vicia faba]
MLNITEGKWIQVWTEDMVKLAITSIMEAETGYSEEILEICSSYSIDDQILCILSTHHYIMLGLGGQSRGNNFSVHCLHLTSAGRLGGYMSELWK